MHRISKALFHPHMCDCNFPEVHMGKKRIFSGAPVQHHPPVQQNVPTGHQGMAKKADQFREQPTSAVVMPLRAGWRTRCVLDEKESTRACVTRCRHKEKQKKKHGDMQVGILTWTDESNVRKPTFVRESRCKCGSAFLTVSTATFQKNHCWWVELSFSSLSLSLSRNDLSLSLSLSLSLETTSLSRNDLSLSLSKRPLSLSLETTSLSRNDLSIEMASLSKPPFSLSNNISQLFPFRLTCSIPLDIAVYDTSNTNMNTGGMGGRTMYSAGATISTMPWLSSGRFSWSKRVPSLFHFQLWIFSYGLWWENHHRKTIITSIHQNSALSSSL